MKSLPDNDRFVGKTILVGMSGGVDSSVAALLLKQQGYDVHGVFMKNWQDDDAHCSAEQDAADAKSVCAQLGIPLTIVNFSDAYWDKVFQIFLREYQAGRTPNPDVLCNKEIKFNAFLTYALAQGADAIATGHYACRATTAAGEHVLMKGWDDQKDQSYFLYLLDQHQLAHSLFPIGELTKITVRAIAKQVGLVTHNKKDSTGICFIGERKFKTFLQEYLPAQPGVIEDDHGHPIGRHEGLMYYTLGQRKGLGIGGLAPSSPAPWYVLHKDIERNVLIVGQEEYHPRLLQSRLFARAAHFIAGIPPRTPYHCTAKIRYRQADQSCRIDRLNDDQLEVHFDDTQRAIAPGQSIVFYEGKQCLGGATITGT